MPSPFMVLTNTVSKLRNQLKECEEEVLKMRDAIERRGPPKDHLLVEQLNLNVRYMMDQIVDINR